MEAVITENQPSLGGQGEGGGSRHNCLDKAVVTFVKYLEFGEEEITLKCELCGKQKVTTFIRPTS